MDAFRQLFDIAPSTISVHLCLSWAISLAFSKVRFSSWSSFWTAPSHVVFGLPLGRLTFRMPSARACFAILEYRQLDIALANVHYLLFVQVVLNITSPNHKLRSKSYPNFPSLDFITKLCTRFLIMSGVNMTWNRNMLCNTIKGSS